MSDRLIGKLNRAAFASFLNGLRLHNDAILLYNNDRIPSALLTSALSIEEFGKFLILEDMSWHNRVEGEWDEDQLQDWLKSTYSHRTKQKWFASQDLELLVAKPMLRILQSGELEDVKQKAIYVGFPRGRNRIQYEKRLQTPFRKSKRRVEGLITVVNDFLILMAVGTRKGVLVVDVPQIASTIAEHEFEIRLCKTWQTSRPSAANLVKMYRELDDLS